MKIKYFRFLYYGRKNCLLHLGEIEDTRNEERVTFLYLEGNGGAENTMGEDNQNFSYPKNIDYLILGEISDDTTEVLEEILKETAVDTVIFPETGIEDGSTSNTEKTTIKTKIKTDITVKSNTLIKIHGVSQINHLIGLTAGTGNSEFQKEIAGWRLRIGSVEEGSVVLLHGLTEANDKFEDCVMHVGFLDGAERRGWWEETDPYAAAMRCTVHQDYDACKHQNSGKGEKYLTESLLYGKTNLGKCLEWMDSCEDTYKLGRRLRFLGLPTQRQKTAWDGRILSDVPTGHKRYYVCAPGEPASLAVGQICRKNPYQVLCVTGEGTGISCCGFLKYAE